MNLKNLEAVKGLATDLTRMRGLKTKVDGAVAAGQRITIDLQTPEDVTPSGLWLEGEGAAGLAADITKEVDNIEDRLGAFDVVVDPVEGG